MAYASPDLLGGAPVTPAVDVHSLAAVLQELLGDDDAQLDELGGIVRELLRAGPGGGFVTVSAFAAALQDAVRRTGTIVARQSIGAQVRGVCEKYLLERRRQVRALLETAWSDEKRGPPSSAPAPRPAVERLPPPTEMQAAAPPVQVEAEGDEDVGGDEDDDSPDLDSYDEESGEDAVTRIFDGEESLTEGTSQPEAWMHDSGPSEASRASWSRWAVVGMLGVLVAVASGAAVMASRSATRGGERAVAAAASEPGVAVATAPSAVVEAQPVAEAQAAAVPPAAGATAGSPGTTPAGQADDEEAADSDDPEVATQPAAAQERPGQDRRAVARKQARRRAAARRRARAASPAAPGTAAAQAEPEEEEEDDDAAEAEPATVAVVDLPEAAPETRPAAPAQAKPAPAAAAGSDDLIVEEGPAKVAYLSVTANPYATIFIDGQKVGVTPLVRLELVPGQHRMVARTEDGRTKRFTLQLEPGITESVPLVWDEE
jgi:hypothetical protein